MSLFSAAGLKRPARPALARLACAFLLVLLPACAQQRPAEAQRWYQAATVKPYDEVLAEL